jgi:hypothetical protein
VDRQNAPHNLLVALWLHQEPLHRPCLAVLYIHKHTHLQAHKKPQEPLAFQPVLEGLYSQHFALWALLHH